MTKPKNESKPKLTTEQELSITERNKNLLVSASAGSGKTYVMIERIKEMIRLKETGVQDILVVTFTKAAASEMKDRLVRGLEAIEPKDEYILDQLSTINAASISTLHSFCAKLLKQYFYVVGLDPSFVLIDEIESGALKSKALTKLIDSRFVLGDKVFFELLDIFSINRKEDNFRAIILKFYDYLLTQINDEEWFTGAIKRSYHDNLKANECSKFVNDYVVDEFLKLKQWADEILIFLSDKDQPRLVEVVNSIYINLLKIKKENDFLLNSKRLQEFEKVKSIPAKVSEDAGEIKELVKAFKEKYTEIKALAEKQLLFDKSGEMESRLKITKDRVLAIFEYTRIFKEIYDGLKKDKVALDFSDLEEYTLKLLSNLDIAKAVQEKYKYVFVDEYQDTNLIQEEILKKITRPNNLFMVGDVKQSIYKFRASEPEIFVDKYKRYASGKDSLSRAINLNHNFRSHQDILEFTNIVFNRNMTENFGQVNYKADARLVKGDSPYPKVSDVPAVQLSIICNAKKEKEDIVETLPIYSVKNHERDEDGETLKKAECEGKLIVNHIKELLGKEIYVAKEKSTRRIDYKDMAILTASRGQYLELVLRELEKAKIPFSSDIELGVFEDSYVGTIRSFLELLQNFEQDMHLMAVMNSAMFDFDINDLAEIRLSAPDARFFFQAVDAARNSDKISLKLKGKLQNLISTIEHYSFLSKFLRVDELIMEIIKGTGFVNKILAREDSQKSISLINKLIAFLSGKSYNISNSKFLDYIKDNEIKFGLQDLAGGVTVTTIHKSKGLEYPVVILMGAGQPLLKRNRGEFLISKRFGAGIDYYDNVNRIKQKTIVKNAIILETDRAEKEERLRLLYVALTRAVNHLIIIGVVKDKFSEGNPQDAESFLDWILPIVNSVQEKKGRLDFIVKNYSTLDFKLTQENSKPDEFDVSFNKGKSETEQKIKSVLEFKYKYLGTINLPVKTSVSEILKNDENDYFVPKVFNADASDAIEKGLAYHKILANINLKANTIELFNSEMDRLIKQGLIDESDLKYVNLKDIFDLLINPKFKELISSKLLREQEFIALTKLDGKDNGEVVLQGIVDLIAITDDGIIVVDYKTNNSKREDFYISHYKKQLDIYSEVAARSLNKKVIKKLIYSFSMKKFIAV